ncbi:MAG: hypothetical protein ACHRXM_35435 [Isosphaerales bacterium]
MNTARGMASAIGRTAGSLAVWGLRFHGANAPGRRVIIDGRVGLVTE